MNRLTNQDHGGSDSSPYQNNCNNTNINSNYGDLSDNSSKNKVRLVNLNIFFNNVGGFLSKNHIIKNDQIADEFDILIFQETNLKPDHVGTGYDDFSICNKVSLNLSLADNSKFSRGTIIAWNPNKCDINEVKRNCASGFEIKTVLVETGFDSFHIVSAYCSPSQTRDRYNQFFNAFQDTLASIPGKILTLGDWNIDRTRRLHHPHGEGVYLQMVESTGLTSEISGITRPSSGFQLDYAYSNIDGVSTRIVDGFSDHKAFEIILDVYAKTVRLPARGIKATNSIPKALFDQLVEEHVPKLIEKGVDTRLALMEMEILLWELTEELYTYRIIPAHTRVVGCSRQISKTILNSDMSSSEKRRKIKFQQQLDASRKLTKNLTNGSGGERLMASYTLGAKRKQLVRCQLSPEDFKNDILSDESKTDHSTHNVPFGKWHHLIRPLVGQELENAVKKVKKKWLLHGGFSEKFWMGMGSKMMTNDDVSVHSFSSVEPVEKDRSKPKERKSWRMVWKPTSPIEKVFDCLRSILIDASSMTNDAYCQFRSTQRTLAKVSSWPVTREDGLLGCDFANAFGNACRSCVNELLGWEFLNPEIKFTVNTDAGSSEQASSLMGTGAGRATGGPGFNILFNHHISTHPATKDLLNRFGPFADDSEILTKLKSELIKRLIESFEQAQEFGLRVHRTGSKGPTLLVHSDVVNGAIEMLEDGGVRDVNVVEEVKFLGLNIRICKKNNCMVGRLPDKVSKKLNYLVIELGRNYSAVLYFRRC